MSDCRYFPLCLLRTLLGPHRLMHNIQTRSSVIMSELLSMNLFRRLGVYSVDKRRDYCR